MEPEHDPVALWQLLSAGGPKPEEARSPHWGTVRAKHLLAQPECQVCDTCLGVEVHHIQPFHLHPELELDERNLISLCLPHHLLAGHLMRWKSFNPDCRADVARWRAKIKGRPDGNAIQGRLQDSGQSSTLPLGAGGDADRGERELAAPAPPSAEAPGDRESSPTPKEPQAPTQ